MNEHLPHCKNCGRLNGTIKLTDAEQVSHFGHVLTEAESGYCSQKCLAAAEPFGSAS